MEFKSDNENNALISLSTEKCDAYRMALKQNESKVLSLIGENGMNLSAEQLYSMTENYFSDNNDKYLFEDLLVEEHIPLLSFSDVLLEKVYQKTKDFALGSKSRFLEAARLGSLDYKYLLHKDRVDDIIVKCCMDGKTPSTNLSDEQIATMMDLAEYNASTKSMESFHAILKSLSAKLKKDLTPKGVGVFKKKISDEEKEKTLVKFEKDVSKLFDALGRIINYYIESGLTDFYDKVSPVAIEEFFDLMDDVRKEFGREENGRKTLNVSYEEFLLQFINYYVSVAQIKKLSESGSFVPVSNWKLNEAFRILGEYSSNPGIQYQLIEKYAKEKNNSMMYFPFEIISDILCKSDSGWDINKKCLDVVFEVVSENEIERPKIEKLVTQVVVDFTRSDRVRQESFFRYFDLIKNDLRSLVPWIKDSIVPKIFCGEYSRASVSIASKILSLEGTDGIDDGLDASREKCVDYLKENFESDSLEILNTIKNFLCLQSCRNSVLKEKIYERFYSAFGSDSGKKIQFNHEILEGLKNDENSRAFLSHVCAANLDLTGDFADSQKSILRDSVDFLIDAASVNDDNSVAVLSKFIFEGKDRAVSKDALDKILGNGNAGAKKICFSLIGKICKKNEAVEDENHAEVLKAVLDYLFHMSTDENLDVDKKLLLFLGIDFSIDRFALSEYGKKSVNYMWSKNENNSPLWQEIKFDYIQTISKCRSVDILQYAFEKACR